MAPRGLDKLLEGPKKYWAIHGKILQERYGQQVIDILDLPIKIILSPITLAIDFVGSAPRGFGVPKLVSDIAFSSIFVVGTLGAYDIALEMGKKVLCPRNCRTCNGWQALRCTMCKGTGEVHYQVQNYKLRSGERATAENIADAVIENRAELVHLPSAVDFPFPLPSKECPHCDGSGVMGCPECKDRQLKVQISADNVPPRHTRRPWPMPGCLSRRVKYGLTYVQIMEPPWKAYNVLQRMDYPYENIVESMKDPKIANFWLLTMPQIMGGFDFSDDVKQKIWWTYKESMRYDQLRDVVAKRAPGWEHLQDVLISIDPARAKDDPVIVKNVPYYKAKKTLEAEVMMLAAPPRPKDWGSQDLELPLSASSWTEEELKDPKKLLEMTSLLTAQSELADKILDAQWENKWRQEKLNELLQSKVQPYIQSADQRVLPEPIIMQSRQEEKSNELMEDKLPPYIQTVDTSLPQSLFLHRQQEENKKRQRQRRWWFF